MPKGLLFPAVAAKAGAASAGVGVDMGEAGSAVLVVCKGASFPAVVVDVAVVATNVGVDTDAAGSTDSVGVTGLSPGVHAASINSIRTKTNLRTLRPLNS